jgi:hypothetical protein
MIRFQYFNLQDQDVQRGLRDGEAGQAAGVIVQTKDTEEAKRGKTVTRIDRGKNQLIFLLTWIIK